MCAAAAASIAGCPAVIVVPNNAPRVKVENCRWWGAEVVFYDRATEDRAEITQAIADQRGMTIISPFDDHAIMAGAVLSKKANFAGKTVAIVASGGNVDPAVYTRALNENPLKLGLRRSGLPGTRKPVQTLAGFTAFRICGGRPVC